MHYGLIYFPLTKVFSYQKTNTMTTIPYIIPALVKQIAARERFLHSTSSIRIKEAYT